MGNLNLRPQAAGLGRLDQLAAHTDRLLMSRRVSSALLSIGSADMTIQNSNFSTADTSTYTDLTGCSVSFTLEHPTPLLYLWMAPVRVVSGSTYAVVTVFAYQGVTNIGSADGGLLADSRNGGYVSLSGVGTGLLQAGTYTAKAQVATDSGLTLGVRSIHLQIFQIGTRDA